MDILKKCTGCKEEQPLTNFYKNKLNHDGHSNYCVDCTKVNSKKYFQRKKEKTLKIESENMMKMALLTNYNYENGSPNAENLMKILMIEKMCKSILGELDSLKKSLVSTESEITK